MKFLSLLILVFILCFSTETVGQTISLKEKETNWTFAPIIYSGTLPSFEPNFLSGLMVKRKFDLFTVRTNIELNTSIDNKDKISCCDMTTSEGFAKSGMLRIGIEKGIMINNYFRPYLATEFAVTRSYLVQNLEGGVLYFHNRITTKSSSIGLFQSAGIECLINKNVSLAVESSVSLLRTKSNVKTTSLIHPDIVNSSINTRTQMDLYLISAFTLNINF
ncbi:MAG: hypothetical protein ACKVQV_15210 [Bacteroidia bacterium]